VTQLFLHKLRANVAQVSLLAAALLFMAPAISLAQPAPATPPGGDPFPSDPFPTDVEGFASDLPPEPLAPPVQPGANQPPAPTQPGVQPAPQQPAPLTPPPTRQNNVPAQQAINPSQSSQPMGSFALNTSLGRAPRMLGDFFGSGFAPMSGEVFVGRAVHHTTSINDFHRIDESGAQVTYLGGPNGNAPLTFFVFPDFTGPDPPAPSVVEGLTTTGGQGNFTAIRTSGDPVNVFDSPAATMPDIMDADVFDIIQIVAMELPAAGPGDIIGRSRLSDNNSALPQDRVYLDYSYFHNAALTANGVDVNRFSPGIEKTFGDGIGSVEVRMPMGFTINSSRISGAGPDTSNAEFGNMVIAPKLLLFANEDLALAAGMGVTLPTGDDIDVRMANGVEVLSITNEAVHLLPYLAMLYAPEGSNAFAHAFLTFDFDTNGAATYANVTGGGLERIGTWRDQNLVSLNVAYGQFLYQSQCQCDRLKSVAWSTELHYTATMNDADSVTGGTFTVGNSDADLSLLNGTIGGHMRVGQTTLTLGYTTPLTSNDRVFDGEIRFFANRAF